MSAHDWTMGPARMMWPSIGRRYLHVVFRCLRRNAKLQIESFRVRLGSNASVDALAALARSTLNNGRPKRGESLLVDGGGSLETS
jgi:hypothetical protein